MDCQPSIGEYILTVKLFIDRARFGSELACALFFALLALAPCARMKLPVEAGFRIPLA